MKKTIFTISLCFVISCSAVAQENYKKLADSLRYVTEVPYIENCKDPVFWKIVSKGKDIVPHLIDKMTDTRKLEKDVYVRFFGGKYTVADIAYVAIQEIIADIPTFELLDVPFHEECGYCSYWYYVRESKKNRKKFQRAVRNWYEENKDYLIWWESSHSVTGDCFIAPTKGHYIVRHKIFDDFPPLRQLQCGLWINKIGNIAFKEVGLGCELNDEGFEYGIDRYLTWAYTIPESGCESMSEDEFWEKCSSSLKDVVDTASFKILNSEFFMDKNFIYRYEVMACGGHIFVRHQDKMTEEQVRQEEFNAYPLVSAEEVARIAPVIKKWTDFYKLDFAKARLVNVDTTCFNSPQDDEWLYYSKIDEKEDTDKRIDVDYSPDKQRYVDLQVFWGYEEKDGKYYFNGWDDGQEIYLIDRKQKHQNMITRMGSLQLAEAVFWKSDDMFILVGYSRYYTPFRRFVYVFDITNQTKNCYEIMTEQEDEYSGYMDKVYWKEKGIIVVD